MILCVCDLNNTNNLGVFKRFCLVNPIFTFIFDWYMLLPGEGLYGAPPNPSPPHPTYEKFLYDNWCLVVKWCNLYSRLPRIGFHLYQLFLSSSQFCNDHLKFCCDLHYEYGGPNSHEHLFDIIFTVGRAA